MVPLRVIARVAVSVELWLLLMGDTLVTIMGVVGAAEMAGEGGLISRCLTLASETGCSSTLVLGAANSGHAQAFKIIPTTSVVLRKIVRFLIKVEE